MANILLTEKCIRACPYCFAQKYMEGEKENDRTLSWENLVYLADFLKRTNENQVSLLGGEPTLHPHFTSFVLYLLNRGFIVTVFTSGVMSARKLRRIRVELGEIDPARLHFVCNVNDPKITPKNELQGQIDFMEDMGKFTSPGFNIYEADFDISFIFDYIEKYQLRRHIRLGLAHPIYQKENSYVKPNELRTMVQRLVQMFPKFERHRVSPGFDCGMPLCMYENEELGALLKISMGAQNARFCCGPAIDIGPNMDVWSCFPLSQHNRRSIFDFEDMGKVVQHFAGNLAEAREQRAGVFDDCKDCVHRKNGTCAGGCVVHGMNQLAGSAPACEGPTAQVNKIEFLREVA